MGVGLEENIRKSFPPSTLGSGRGIEEFNYIRSLVFHFIGGDRYWEDIYDIKNNKGFIKLIKIDQIPIIL